MARKIKSIDSLENQILLLQAKAKILEDRLDDNLDYLQDNYSSMIMRSLFKTDGAKTSLVGSIAGFFLGNEKLQEALSNIVSTLAEKATIGIEKLSEKLSGKNTD